MYSGGGWMDLGKEKQQSLIGNIYVAYTPIN